MTNNLISLTATEYSPFLLDCSPSIEEFSILLRNPAIEIWALQAYAHQLLEKGARGPEINFASYNYFEGARIRRGKEELERAENIALAFSDPPFQWHYWMGLNIEEQTIKGMEEK
ncbi:MAG: hypothetical protein Q8Q31_00130 [Nanoarchaeota archaeon]|nr:hypothetical protein [Nanoarchaeota archaeon]